MKMDELWRIIKHWWNVAILTRAAFLGLRGTSRTDVLCYFSLASHGTRGTILLWKPCDESVTSQRSFKWSLLCRKETSVQKMHVSNHPRLANTHLQTDQMMSHTFFFEMDKKKLWPSAWMEGWPPKHGAVQALMLAAVTAVSHSQMIREEQVTLSQII